MRDLPRATSSFPKLRNADKIYVDKTALIYELARQEDYFFLSRPRRFGKSLLVSTFASLFRYGLRDFKGLAIESLWTDTTYTTISLDFSKMREASTIEEFNESFRVEIQDELKINCGIDWEFEKGKNPSDSFGAFLKTQSAAGRKVVLLIDEYDSPLNAHLNEPKFFDAILQELNAFYMQMKGNDGAFRFVFITGIAKFGKASAFSMLNHVTDISQDPDYGTLLGYTEAEIRENFAEYLDRAAETLGTSVDNVMNRMREHYDGFCFEETGTEHVFAPWSTLNFLQSPRRGFKNYWADSAGKPKGFIEYLREHPIGPLEEYEDTISISWRDLARLNTLETMRPQTFLFQAGYLSVVEIDPAGNPLLGFPNQEVRSSMAEVYADTLFLEQAALDGLAKKLFRILSDHDAEEFVKLLTHVFMHVAYDNYPLTSEAAVRMAVQLFLTGAGVAPAVEKHTPFGRSDLQFTYAGTLWVFEFKYLYENESSTVARKLAEAKKQIVDRHYGDEVDAAHRVRIAIVFDENAKNFAAWETV